jgi:DNA-binding response OmpR family regulator
VSAEAPRVLIIEDDDAIADAVQVVVVRQGGTGVRAADGREGLRLFFEERADLVVLDVGLPELDGWQVLERIRDLSDVPILMLTARDLEQDKVRGLQGGADDYLTKPFGIHELGARLEALLRRTRMTGTVTPPEEYVDGPLTVSWSAREVRMHERVVDLTPLEFRLLTAFVDHPGQALSADQLLQQAWSDPLGIGPDRVKFTVLRLRRKLGWQEGSGGPIEAVRGYGYRYRPGRAG